MKEIYIKQEENIKKIYLIENNIIIEKHEEDVENPMLEGNIYIGKVQNVITGIGAAFINIGKGKNAFIHLKDILPKVDITKEELDVETTTINEVIKPGDPILVQVTRDKNFKKGARVSCHISLPGRFFVYMPDYPFITISSKIENEAKKEELIKTIKEKFGDSLGGIIRTTAENASYDEIIKDIKDLINTWENLKSISLDKYPKEIYNNGGIIRKYLIDNLDKGLEKIILDDKSLKSEIEKIVGKKVKIEIDEKFLEKFDYENQIKKIENRKIWLDCGGFITIDKTEALTAIDVNSGKYIGKNDFEDTVFTVNREATIEIAKQLRARDIGGIIIIDYIDMHIEKNKKDILKLMEQEIKKDNSKVQIAGFTELNLLEMTRKHIYGG